jgi:hypothetical protein
MSLDFVAEVWEVLNSHIDLNERSDAADSLVNFLIENNYETDDIKNSFRGEKEILKALKNYMSEQEEVYDEDEDYDSDEDEWD